ncbi:PREDICTED: uncharacterized protein LOC105151785 [Acromyrmex echinatior]|uniref:uncharacterized protein LOC105151785 n=1 Tax=Acromyrmex echinatior TaxID=103372 RepID=UPI000580D126|nr:PREDICTED: uncharacterized protein LOC105151785 [Acromyrmex echinatior]
MEDWTVSSDDVEAGAQRGAFLTTYRGIPMLSRGVKGVGRNTLGSLVTRGNQVCRYTMLTRSPGSRCVRHFGRKWSCENAFLRGSRPCCSGLAASQLDHTHAAIQPERAHGPSETLLHGMQRECSTE